MGESLDIKRNITTYIYAVRSLSRTSDCYLIATRFDLMVMSIFLVHNCLVDSRNDMYRRRTDNTIAKIKSRKGQRTIYKTHINN